MGATGLESRHTSRYFFKRAGRKHTSRLWTKLALACDTASHFLTGAAVSLGPANDAPLLRPVMAQASLAVGYDRVLADCAFDSEETYLPRPKGRDGKGMPRTVTYKVKVDTKKAPHTIELTPASGKRSSVGIYKVEGGELYLALGRGKKAPKEFKGEDGTVYVMRREKAKECRAAWARSWGGLSGARWPTVTAPLTL